MHTSTFEIIHSLLSENGLRSPEKPSNSLVASRCMPTNTREAYISPALEIVAVFVGGIVYPWPVPFQTRHYDPENDRNAVALSAARFGTVFVICRQNGFQKCMAIPICLEQHIGRQAHSPSPTKRSELE